MAESFYHPFQADSKEPLHCSVCWQYAPFWCHHQSSPPLNVDEQSEIFKVGAEMGRRLAESFAACLSIEHPIAVVESSVEAWDREFRKNLKVTMSMTPEELARHEEHRKVQERRDQILRDYERAKRKLHDAQWTLQLARNAAIKEGVL
jgi:hypothetical protein